MLRLPGTKVVYVTAGLTREGQGERERDAHGGTLMINQTTIGDAEDLSQTVRVVRVPTFANSQFSSLTRRRSAVICAVV